MKPEILSYPITPATHLRVTRGWEEIRRNAVEKGIHIEPDGRFSGRATGRVQIDHDKVTVTIVSKPWLIPLAAIDAELRGLFS